MQLRHGDTTDKVVLRIDHDRHAINGHRNFNEFDSSLGAQISFAGLDGSRGVGDVGFSVAKLLEAAAGTGDPNGDPDVVPGENTEFLSHGLGYRENSAGTVDGDFTAQDARSAVSVGRAGWLALPTGG